MTNCKNCKMTDEYCASGDCNKTQANDLACNKISLTEQWKKGKFIICNAGKCQYYYVQNEKQQEVIKTEYCLFDDNTPNWQILAPVPSYKELQNMNKAVNECMAANIKLVEQNAQLKELLKEIRQQITEQVFGSPKIQLFEGTFDDKLLAKIDEALR